MKCLVIYFSITGNTKKIAQAIYSGIRSTGEQCDVVRMRDVDSPDLAGYDLIGLGGPVMWIKEPPNITDFVNCTLKKVDGKHAFAFCTHGAMPALYLARVVPAMMQRGLTIIGWNDWFAGVYFPCVPKPYFTDGHPDAIDIKEAKDFGRIMVERSRRINAGETQLIPTFPRGSDYDELYNPLLTRGTEKGRKETERKFDIALSVKFMVNKEKCKYPKCTFCIDNCPMGAIDFSFSPPLFNKSCFKCFLCEMACPHGAIDFDFTQFQEAHQVKKDDDSLGLMESLSIFEKRGRFRRLVRMEDVGWGTSVWQLKKPRYTIA